MQLINIIEMLDPSAECFCGVAAPREHNSPASQPSLAHLTSLFYFPSPSIHLISVFSIKSLPSLSTAFRAVDALSSALVACSRARQPDQLLATLPSLQHVNHAAHQIFKPIPIRLDGRLTSKSSDHAFTHRRFDALLAVKPLSLSCQRQSDVEHPPNHISRPPYTTFPCLLRGIRFTSQDDTASAVCSVAPQAKPPSTFSSSVKEMQSREPKQYLYVLLPVRLGLLITAPSYTAALHQTFPPPPDYFRPVMRETFISLL